MITQRTPTQKEVDTALLKELGIKPVGLFTKDGTQQLYENPEGKGFMLPHSKHGYSYYAVDDILAHVKKTAFSSKVIDRRDFVAKPQIKLAKSDD